MPCFARFLLALLPLLLLACGDGASTPAATAPSGAIEEIEIRVGDLVFDARAAGPAAGEPVLLLHGFPSSSWQWADQLEALGRAGYRAVAPDQRGYSPGARPEGVQAYAIPNLIFDALGIADALGWARFHLVGHDWGAGVAWGVAAVAPQRLLTLNPISVPHPDAFAAELADPDSCQFEASAYFDFFVQPGFEDVLLADDASLLRGIFEGVDPADVDVHLRTLGTPDAMRAALNWYRANVSRETGLGGGSVGLIDVPTLFIWSDQDAALCREGAERTADFIAGRYRFEVIEGVNHWVTEIAGTEVAQLLLEHFAAP